MDFGLFIFFTHFVYIIPIHAFIMKPSIALFLWVFAVATLACGQSAGPAEQVLAPAAYQAAIEAESSLQLVDVRTAPEFAQGHLAQAINIDMRQSGFVANMEQQVAKDKPVYVYCRSGRRSAAAAQMLRQAGYTEVYDLQGGILNWTAAKMPVAQP